MGLIMLTMIQANVGLPVTTTHLTFSQTLSLFFLHSTLQQQCPLQLLFKQNLSLNSSNSLSHKLPTVPKGLQELPVQSESSAEITKEASAFMFGAIG